MDYVGKKWKSSSISREYYNALSKEINNNKSQSQKIFERYHRETGRMLLNFLGDNK